MKQLQPFQDPEVAVVFGGYPTEIQDKLMFLRQLIFDTAAETEGVGALEETLKWGQPSYLTPESKSGSTFRIDQDKSHEGQYAIYFHCQTNLVETFRQLYPDSFIFGGKRCIIFNVRDDLPVEELRRCIQMALTYHRQKTLRH